MASGTEDNIWWNNENKRANRAGWRQDMSKNGLELKNNWDDSHKMVIDSMRDHLEYLVGEDDGDGEYWEAFGQFEEHLRST